MRRQGGIAASLPGRGSAKAGVLLMLWGLTPAAAQDLSGRQLGPLTLSVEVSGSFAPRDTAFFNDTGYDVFPLRLLWVSGSAALRLGPRAAVLAEIVSENLKPPEARGLYLRLRPFPSRALDLQAGRIPPVFGAFARRSYGAANPLIGLPLGYQYLTTLRSDAVPASADDLLGVRGRGWLLRQPIGNTAPAPGLPLAEARTWDTGLEARIGHEPWSLAAAVTQGTLAAPRVRDDNDGKQVSARLACKPSMGLTLGVSGARGAYTDRRLAAFLPPAALARGLRQQALGADVEQAHGHWIVRGELIWSRFDLPRVSAPFVPRRVSGLAFTAEAVHKLAPGLHAAARLDRLAFSQIRGSARSTAWDAPVTRIEAGLGWQPARPLGLKAVYQYNWRAEGYAGRHGFVAAQAWVRY